jgi:acetate kinase
MEQTLTINSGSVDLTFDVLDQDNEMAITAFDNFEDKETIIYLKKENIQSLKKHLEYILEQM